MDKPTLFDANCFVGGAPAPQPGAYQDAQGLLQAMDNFGIEEALVTHPLAVTYDPAAGNARLLQEIAAHPRLHPCAVVTPDPKPGEDSPQVDRLIASGVRAVRILPRCTGPLRPWNCGRLFEALARHAMPTLVDFELEHYRGHMQQIDWDGLAWVLAAFPQLPLVLVRAGQALDRVLFPLLERHPNLHIETSYYIGTGGLERLSGRFGAERLLFGTGMPRYSPGPAVTLLTYCGLSVTEKQCIGGENLRRLLRSVRPA